MARSSRLTERTKSPWPVVVVGELLPGVGQHLGDEPRRALQPAGDVAGGREQAARLAERDAVEILHLAAHGPVLGALGELPQRGAVELVGLPELVHEPDPLLGVAHDVRRELRRDDHVDRPPVALGEVEQAPREGLGQHLGAGIPLERDRDDLRLVPPRAQLLDQRVGEDLGAAVGEGHLRPAHGNAHRGYPFSLRNAASSACNLSTCSWRSSTSRSAAALNERWSYASGSTYHRISLAQHRLDGSADAAANAGPEAQRAVCRDGPEPLGLVTRGAAVGGVSAARGIGPGEAHLLAQALEERVDVDRGGDGFAGARVRVYRAVGHRAIVAPPPDATGPAGPATGPARQYDRRVISVCMATFNGARFVERQVATILEQLEPGDELVVSDDGSTDETVALVRAFGDPRIRILEGHGFEQPAAQLRACRPARGGETIVLADQDDVWLPNKLPLVRELFAGETARPYLVVLDARIVDEDERVVYPSVQAKLHAGPGFVKNIWANRYLGCCMAFSRDLLDVALPFPAAVDMHDIWLGQLCERIGTTAFVPVTTMLYRRHDDNATGFERRFQPVQQVRRRAALVWELARRCSRRRASAARA